MSAAAAPRIAPVEWMTAAKKALAYVAETALRAPALDVEPVASPVASGIGAFVAVMVGGMSVQVGLVADPAAALGLARRMMDFGPDDHLDDAAVADALGELANMVAGATKAGLASQLGVGALGLPMIVLGRVAASDHQSIRGVRAHVGGFAIELVVIEARR